jgi:diguanylate cyclase (GGDEF)-like protein
MTVGTAKLDDDTSPRGRLPVTTPKPTAITRLRSSRLWIAGAVVLVVVAVLASVVAASLVAKSNASTSRKTFQRSSANVASTLQLAIEHQNDLTLDTSAFVLSGRDPSQRDFLRWMTSARAFARYPELEAVGVVRIVRASQLAAFAARAIADPSDPLSARGRFTVTPAGSRPFYCLTSAAESRTLAVQTAAGADSCATAAGAPLLAARDSGRGEYAPFDAGNQTWLGIENPIYRGATIPTTTATRRAAFVGWVGILADPTVLMDRSLKGHPHTAVSLHYIADDYRAGRAGNVTFTAGHAPAGAASLTTSLHNGWTVTTYGAVAATGVFADPDAWLLLIACIGFSILLGAVMILLATGRDRARRLVAQRTEQLRHQALHDALTGLPNRALVLDRVEQSLALNRRHGWTGAVLYIDIDDFKNVNDTLGHQAGDQLLVAVAARLENALRKADSMGRMGGDEFIVLVDGAAGDAAPAMVAERLLASARRPFEIEAAPTPITVNISIGIATGDRPSAGDLLRDADVALYEAKALGKGRYAIFDPTAQTVISRRNDLEFELRSALAGNQYRLHYQPIYDLDDLTIVSAEALIRWERPGHGLVPPDEFIPVLEQTGQMQAVGRWVLNQACQQMATWHRHGDHLEVSVNISGRQLDDDAIVTDIRDALEASGLDARSLTLEITETVLMRDAEATTVRLHAIKELGVSIAIDDFGTGYSSLAYLRQFPVDCLKIDRMFTSSATGSPGSETLLRTLVQLGNDLGLTTVAEGVETTAEMDLLRQAGVNRVQGFLMSRPLDPIALETALLAPLRPGTWRH